MEYTVFSKYYQLSINDKVKPLLCGMDSDHPILVPNMDDDDNIYLYCLACKFKMKPGLQLYLNIESILKELNNE